MRSRAFKHIYENNLSKVIICLTSVSIVSQINASKTSDEKDKKYKYPPHYLNVAFAERDHESTDINEKKEPVYQSHHNQLSRDNLRNNNNNQANKGNNNINDDKSLASIESLHHDEFSYDSSEDDQTITNWSSTHSCSPDYIYYPKSTREVLSILKQHHNTRTKVRPVGNALSPNGIGMCDKKIPSENNNIHDSIDHNKTTITTTNAASSQISQREQQHNLINVSHIDHIRIDIVNQTVTVGAGATIQTILKELKKVGLTLSNFSSIQEQQVAGWTQVAAHGTGCQFSTVDEMIVEIEIVTPSKGILRIRPETPVSPSTATSVIPPSIVQVNTSNGISNTNVNSTASITNNINSTLLATELIDIEPSSSQTNAYFSSPQHNADATNIVTIIHSDALFNMVKVGLGSLGVVTEVTLKCIPEVQLKETTFRLDRHNLLPSSSSLSVTSSSVTSPLSSSLLPSATYSSTTSTSSATSASTSTIGEKNIGSTPSSLIDAIIGIGGGEQHIQRLKDYRHVRYMWLPYTSSVIGVVSNPYEGGSVKNVQLQQLQSTNAANVSASTTTTFNNNSKNDSSNNAVVNIESPTKALCDLVREVYFPSSASQPLLDSSISSSSSLATVESKSNNTSNTNAHPSMQTIERLSFSQLRDLLLDYAPLDLQHVQKVNKAEESYWKAIAANDTLNTRIDNSINILGFDCGGEQWVYEVCIPLGTFKGMKNDMMTPPLPHQQQTKNNNNNNNNNTITNSTNSHTTDNHNTITNRHSMNNNTNAKVPKDIEFVQKLLSLIESAGVPAPCPIEQRWTRGSASYMSPAYSPTAATVSNPTTTITSPTVPAETNTLSATVNNNNTSFIGTSTAKKSTTVHGVNEDTDELFTWVGIIMYLPLSQTNEQRKHITSQFQTYCNLIEPLVKEYHGYPHWAKLELPTTTSVTVKNGNDVNHAVNNGSNHTENNSSTSKIDSNSDAIATTNGSTVAIKQKQLQQQQQQLQPQRMQEFKKYLKLKYPVDDFNKYRREFDSHNILSNNLINTIFNDTDDENEK